MPYISWFEDELGLEAGKVGPVESVVDGYPCHHVGPAAGQLEGGHAHRYPLLTVPRPLNLQTRRP